MAIGKEVVYLLNEEFELDFRVGFRTKGTDARQTFRKKVKNCFTTHPLVSSGNDTTGKTLTSVRSFKLSPVGKGSLRWVTK